MSHEKELRAILDQVAAGTLSRREALRRATVLGAGAAAVGMGARVAAQDASPAAGGATATQYEPQGPQVENLTLWSRSSPDTSPEEWNALVAATERYTELVGSPVELITVPDADFRPRMSQAAPGGDGPDIFGLVAHDWVGEFAVQGIALPWEEGEIFAAEDIPQDVFNTVSYEGQVHALPLFSEVLGLYYFTDIIPEPPTTWDELVQMATEATTDGQWGFAFELVQQYYEAPFFHAYGGYIFAFEDGTFNIEDIGLNNEGSVEAAKALRDMYHNQQPPMPEGIIDQANAGQFVQGLEEAGQVGMTINGPWREPALRAAGVNFGVAPLPTAPNGEPLQPFLGVQAFGVNAYSENVDAAKDLVNFLGSSEGVLRMVEGLNRAPVRQSLVDAAVEVNPNLAQWAEAAEQATPMPNIPQMGAVWTPWGDAMVGIVQNNLPDEEVQSLLDAAVEQIQAEVQR